MIYARDQRASALKRKFTIPLILALIAFIAAFTTQWVMLENEDHVTVSAYGFVVELGNADNDIKVPIHQGDLPWFVGGAVGIMVLAVALLITLLRGGNHVGVIACARLAANWKYAIALLLALYVYVRVSRYDSILPGGFIFGK